MNVLTIDVDYAFSPSISAYDDFVIGSRISYENQKKILIDKGCETTKINKSKFNNISKVFKKVSYNTKIITVTHHHEILKHIPHDKDIFLQNIDHHHDIFYPGWHNLEILDEGNWVHHLAKTSRLKKYMWFRNKDSESFCNCIDLNFDFCQKFDLKVEDIVRPDIIILCSSPHWTFDSGDALVKKLLEGLDVD